MHCIAEVGTLHIFNPVNYDTVYNNKYTAGRSEMIYEPKS